MSPHAIGRKERAKKEGKSSVWIIEMIEYGRKVGLKAKSKRT